MSTNPPGTLYLVATPIGHRQDLSPRALEVLQSVALVAAEDTRLSGQLLAHFGVKKPMLSCYEHNERHRAARIVAALQAGDDVALVSSAGSPAISDPGYVLVGAAIAAGAEVVAVPGACAAVLALQISGLPTDTFTFVGFPPKRGGKRRAFLTRALAALGTVVAYVPARDTAAVLDELCELAPAPPLVAVARELTKRHEEVLRGAADAVAEQIRTRVAEGGVWRGEVTLVFAAPEAPEAPLDDAALQAELEDALAEGLDRKAALHQVRSATGVPRARLYGILEAIRQTEREAEGADR